MKTCKNCATEDVLYIIKIYFVYKNGEDWQLPDPTDEGWWYSNSILNHSHLRDRPRQTFFVTGEIFINKSTFPEDTWNHIFPSLWVCLSKVDQRNRKWELVIGHIVWWQKGNSSVCNWSKPLYSGTRSPRSLRHLGTQSTSINYSKVSLWDRCPADQLGSWVITTLVQTQRT